MVARCNTARLVLCLAGLLCPVMAGNAAAADFANCGRGVLRISLHDVATGLPHHRGGLREIQPGQSILLDVPQGRHLLKVFRVYGDAERLVYLRSGIPGDAERFTISMTGGFVFVRWGQDCASNPNAPTQETGADGRTLPDIPIATYMVHTGIWVSGGKTWLQIRGFDGDGFQLVRNPRIASGAQTWSTYRLVGRNRYRDDDGNVFAIDKEFQAAWNGISHRYSWLE